MRRRYAAVQGGTRVCPLVLVLVFGLVVPGCGHAPEDARPNVVIFLIDTLRADWLGIYGFSEDTSPRIDALAARGVVFEQASAPAPWTLPSVASLFTSRFAPEHGLVADGLQLNPVYTTLAERLARAGYATASFYANPYAGPATGLDRGFATSRRMGEQTGREAVERWLEQTPQRPFFLYVHNTEPHDPFWAPEESVRRFGGVSKATRRRVLRAYSRYRNLTRTDFVHGRPPGTKDNTREQRRAMRELARLRREIERLYSAAVRDADARVGEVVDVLRERGEWDDTLFVVLSDHGEELGDRGGWQHDHSVYQELIHVPLVVRFPDDTHAGIRVHEPVSLVDVLPTLLDVVGRPDLIGEVRGRSLLPLLDGAGEAPPRPRVTTTRHNVKKYFRPYREQRGPVNVVVSKGAWKGIWNAAPHVLELYDLRSDPAELHDESQAHPRLAGELRDLAERRLTEWRRSEREPLPAEALDPEDRALLERLGYLDPGALDAPRETRGGSAGAQPDS